MKKVFALLVFICFSLLGMAQDDVEMADGLRASGKIYVVVGALVTILLGIVLFLIIMDRKISDIEKKVNKK